MDEVLQPPDVRDEVVVKIEVGEGGGEGGQVFDCADGVLTETEALDFGEAGEAEGGDGGNASVD